MVVARSLRRKKPINDRNTVDVLVTLCKMGQVKFIKEHTHAETVITAFNASGSLIGTIGPKYKYIIDKIFSRQGSGDGFFAGLDQTTRDTP